MNDPTPPATAEAYGMDPEAFRRSVLNPELPAARKRAVKALTDELDAMLTPLGYRRTGASLWRREGLLWATYLELQKSRSGDRCYINVGRERNGGPVQISAYHGSASWRLAELTGKGNDGGRLDGLHYVDLNGDTQLRREVISLIRDYAVPYLKRLRGPLGFNVRPKS